MEHEKFTMEENHYQGSRAENLKWRTIMIENKGWKTVALSEHVKLLEWMK
jgi:hypothetical protein